MATIIRCDRCRKQVRSDDELTDLRVNIGTDHRVQSVCSGCRREWERFVKNIDKAS
jgi:hypothetical protein